MKYFLGDQHLYYALLNVFEQPSAITYLWQTVVTTREIFFYS